MTLSDCVKREQEVSGLKYRRKTWHKDYYMVFNSHGQIRVYDANGVAGPTHDLSIVDYIAGDWESIYPFPEKVKDLTWTEVCIAARGNPNLLFKNSHYNRPEGIRLKDFLTSIHKEINNLGFFYFIGISFMANDWEIVGTLESAG